MFAFADKLKSSCRLTSRTAINEESWDTEDIPVMHNAELAKHFEEVDSAPEAWESVPVDLF